MIPNVLINLFLALLFGAAIGLERESGQLQFEKEHNAPGLGAAGGIRTYSLIALLGALCGMLYIGNFQPLALLLTAVFLIILVSYYCLNVFITKNVGLTSELAIFFTFLLGMLPMLNIIPLQVVVAVFVVLVLVLSLKSRIRKVVGGISYQEIESFVSYSIIALVILPFLPNVGYKLADLPFLASILEGLGASLGGFSSLELINPQKIWLIVVLITGIDVFGYAMGRLIGNKSSFTLASLIGGFISSTSTTQSLAQRSKKTGAVNYLVGAAILANLASFLQIFLLVGVLSPKLLIYLLPSILIMIMGGAILAFLFLRMQDEKSPHQAAQKRHDKIFSLLPALKFAAILIVVKLGTKICLILFGSSGFVIGSVIASFAGIDAIMVNLSDMAGNSIGFQFALVTFLIINATNLASKSLYAFSQGNRKFALKFSLSIALIVASSFAGLFFVL